MGLCLGRGFRQQQGPWTSSQRLGPITAPGDASSPQRDPYACFRHALDIREHYERKLERANNLYMELNALMLQLELKERELLR